MIIYYMMLSHRLFLIESPGSRMWTQREPDQKNHMMPLGPQAYRMKIVGVIFIRKE